jgi:catechol 2,3-dioxygenase-like lactoylglutathione lyase family enzyme
MLADNALIAFVATCDIDGARAFYEGTLGLPVVSSDPFACVVDAHGTMLRITPVGSMTPAPYTVLGWNVTDIVATIGALAARGVVFTRYDGMGQDEIGIWTAPGGAKVAWFTDFDGNTLSLTEFAGSAT